MNALIPWLVAASGVGIAVAFFWPTKHENPEDS